MSRLVPTLVYGDLRGAGHELLSRSDLDLRWALTLHEALAVSRLVRLDLVIASDHFALAYLNARAELVQRPPCIVLLGDDYLSKRDVFEEAGATALIAASEPRRIVEAISELTGLTFRNHARVPLHTVVDVQFQGENHFLYTFDLSISGVSIRELPNARQGDRATITFDLFDPPLKVEAMVVRGFNLPEAHCTGLCFLDLSESDRTRLAELVERELKSLPMFEADDLDDEPGQETMDLLTAFKERADRGVSEYLNMVKGIVDGWEDEAPSWIYEVAAKLTDTERRAASGDGPEWAKMAVGFRIELKRQVVDKAAVPEFEPAMEFCSSMANEVRNASPEEAVDATKIRSALLRAIYVLHRHAKERQAQATARKK